MSSLTNRVPDHATQQRLFQCAGAAKSLAKELESIDTFDSRFHAETLRHIYQNLLLLSQHKHEKPIQNQQANHA